MPVNIGQLFARNWAIKLAAIFFAVMLYVAVAAQQPLSQRFALRLIVTVPPGRSVRQQPAGVTVTLSGKGSEILKLRSFPRMIRKTIPDTFSGSVWSIHLQPSDVNLPKGTDVQVTDIAPRDLDVLLSSTSRSRGAMSVTCTSVPFGRLTSDGCRWMLHTEPENVSGIVLRIMRGNERSFRLSLPF